MATYVWPSMYVCYNCLSGLAIRRIIENFKDYILKNCSINANIAPVQASVAKSHNLSIPKRFQLLGLCQTTVWKEFVFASYRIVLTKELKPLDHRKLHEFIDSAFETKMIF